MHHWFVAWPNMYVKLKEFKWRYVYLLKCVLTFYFFLFCFRIKPKVYNLTRFQYRISTYKLKSWKIRHAMISRKVYFLLWRNPHRRKPPVGATDRGFPTMGKLVLEAYACTMIPSGDRLMGSVGLSFVGMAICYKTFVVEAASSLDCKSTSMSGSELKRVLVDEIQER